MDQQQLQHALAEVFEAKAVGEWMLRPNAAFDGLKPVEVLERGEVDKILAMLQDLNSGVA